MNLKKMAMVEGSAYQEDRRAFASLDESGSEAGFSQRFRFLLLKQNLRLEITCQPSAATSGLFRRIQQQ
jgi:hypothetical protein